MTFPDPTKPLKATADKLESWFQQGFAVFSVAYLCISCGNFLGYTSSAIPSIKEDLHIFSEISHHDVSWIGGLGPLGALAGSLFTLIPLPRFGSRRTIAYFGAPALITSWLIIGFSKCVEMIFLGRFLGGAGTGIVIACAPLYVMDVSNIKMRGKLGILPQFLMVFGILLAYILGSILNWRYLALSCAIISTPSLMLLTFAPDSPEYLVRKSKGDKAFTILEQLHGTSKAVEMLRELQSKVAISQQMAVGARKKQMNIGTIKASAVALGILSFQQLTGINGVTFYAVSIFREASGNDTIDAHIPSIILASTQLLASFISTLFIERFGRKILLIISSVLMTFAGTSLGTYFYCGTDLEYLYWVPLVSLIIFAFGFAIGYGPVSWILIAEILPVESRHIMNPLAIAYNWFCVFLVTKSFPLLLLEINIFGIFWLYASIAFVGLIFVVVCIPETKSKTSDEIRMFFDKSAKLEKYCDIENCSEEIKTLKVSQIAEDCQDK